MGDTIAIVSFMVKRPCVVIFLTIGLTILLSMLAIMDQIASGTDLINTPRSDADLSHHTAVDKHALNVARDMIFYKKFEDELNLTKVVPQQSTEDGFVLMAFEATSSSQFFEAETIKAAMKIQRKIEQDANYSDFCLRDPMIVNTTGFTPAELCAPILSPLNMFYPSVWNTTLIDEISAIFRRVEDYTTKLVEINNCILKVNEGTLGPLLVGLLAPPPSESNESNPPSDSNESEAASEASTDILDLITADALRDILPIYRTLIDGQCPGYFTNITNDEIIDIFHSSTSLAPIIAKFDGRGEFKDPEVVLDLVQHFYKVPQTKPLTDFYFDKNFSQNFECKFTRLMFQFATPLAGYNNSDDRGAEQNGKFVSWFSARFRTYLQNDIANDAFDTTYLSTAFLLSELGAILMSDSLKAIGSLVFVFGYLSYQTSSIFLAAMGMVEILLSLPLAFAFYSLVCQFSYLSLYCPMCLYIIAAIGADDIFVFFDAYKASAFQGPKVLASFETRFSWVYKRAAGAMFITSLTTMAAFIATSFSPLTSVRSFGIYAAFVILADYLLVITFFPACLVVYHNRMEGHGCGICSMNCCFGGKIAETSTERYLSGKTVPEHGKVEFFFHNTFAPFVTRNKLKFLAGFGVWTISNIVFALELGPNQDEEQMLPRDHPFQKLNHIINQKFDSFRPDNNNEMLVYWGIDGIDREGVSLLNDPNNLGQPVFDSTFKFDEPAQEWLLNFCTNVESKHQLISPDEPNRETKHVCFIKDFKTYITTSTTATFPVPESSVATHLTNFLASSPRLAEKYTYYLGLYDEQLKWVATKFQMDMDRWKHYSTDELEQRYQSYSNLVTTQMKTAPASLSSVKHTDQRGFWIRMRTQEIYLSSAITGGISGTILAFVVILGATRCLRVALFAAMSIAGVLLSILGFMVLTDWKLGTIESINITILAGFSVDYIVHLAHAFNVSQATDRTTRVHEAMAEIGISVFSGMTTSVGASLLLFTCQLQFFAVFGKFLCLTIIFSWAWANLFFMSLLALAGPNEKKVCSL